MNLSRVVRRTGDLALSAAALVGLLCVVVLLAGNLLGVRPVIVLSGSMSPAIPAGSLAVARQVTADDLKVGDVVTVPAGDRQVTHRVVTVTHHGGSATLRLRGDANERADEETTVVRSAPRVVGSVPGAGRVIAWFSRAPGVFVLGGYAALLLTIVAGRSGAASTVGRPRGPSRPNARGQHASRRRRVRLRPLVPDGPARTRHRGHRIGAGFLALAIGSVCAEPARAAWGDFAAVSGSSVGTATVPVPATFTCGALGVRSVTFTWTAVPGATGYTLHYGSGGAQTKAVTGTSTTVTATVASGTAWLQAVRDFGGTSWTSGPTVTRTYTVAVVSLCS